MRSDRRKLFGRMMPFRITPISILILVAIPLNLVLAVIYIAYIN